MPELSYLVWELQAVRHRESLHHRRDAESPGYIKRAAIGQLGAVVVCLSLAVAGNAIALVDLTSSDVENQLQNATQLRIAYIVFLCLEVCLLIVDSSLACVVGSSWMRGRMGAEKPNRREQRVQVCSVFIILAFSLLADFPLTLGKFLFLHWTRFTSATVRPYILLSGFLTAVAYAGKTALGFVHYVWKQMTPRVDPLHEKAPVYFETSPLCDSLLWGISMMMPVVNMLFAIVVICMSFMTTKLN
ncbi:hypothetical protein BOX15_Mlig016427g1 [Macrostomum lignano]|uniref:Ion_trans domain-containing protein n=2 Tax=Macrostomum lignano TaxID=282301 RepID=A0A1I8FJP8_9PLAT|nr:hypothetical protein BOX15_Mlig022680g1 [Macrostomum lignano]PAA84933.1 hypothetical protein BOX15_Mlig016427g1 [Macrostomum lignano]